MRTRTREQHGAEDQDSGAVVEQHGAEERVVIKLLCLDRRLVLQLTACTGGLGHVPVGQLVDTAVFWGPPPARGPSLAVAI